MLEVDNEDIINNLLKGLSNPKRKTNGRDRSKNYHKITISIDEKAKQEIIEYASEHNISISKLIKDLLIENEIISSKI